MNPDDYVSAAEAARLLNVSRQRVSAMIRDGDLPAVTPWPRAVRIHRSAIDAWKAGHRPEPVTRTAVRNFVLYEADVTSIAQVDTAKVGELCLRFISERRPGWDQVDSREWAASMARSLTRTP